MNRIKTKIGFLGIASMFMFTSCMPDAITPDNIGTFASVGDIIIHDDKVNFDIVTDNYDTLKVLNPTTIKPDQIPTGTRVSFKSKVYEIVNGVHNTYKGDLFEIYKVEVKKYELLSEVKDDETLGDDNIEVLQFTFSDRYINNTYRIRQNDIAIKHKITYIIDDETPAEKGVLNIIIKHNMNGDSPSQDAVHMASCNIEKYINEATDGTLTINLHYKGDLGENKVKTVTWKKDWWKSAK